MKITPVLTLAFLVSLSLSAQDSSSPQALSAQVGAGLSFWNFTNERAIGSDTFDFRLKPALAPEISFQLLVNGRLGLLATAGAWLTRLKDGHFYNEFSETRHAVSHRQGRNFYFAAGPVVRLLSLESGPSVALSCKGGYFFSQVPEINEEFILLEDFRRRRLEYRFSRGKGWIWQPGLALNTPAEPIGVRLELLANFIRTEQDFTIRENGNLLENGRLITYYNGWAAQLSIFYLFGK